LGNANNGNASTFGPNGTDPDVTETTGLEVVNPIDALSSGVPVPSGNSAEVDPLIQPRSRTNHSALSQGRRTVPHIAASLTRTESAESAGSTRRVPLRAGGGRPLS